METNLDVRVAALTMTKYFALISSLQWELSQHVRIFFLSIISWILSWWHVLHVAHHRPIWLRHSLSISRIPTQGSSHVRKLLCSDFRWAGRDSTHNRQILRLCVSSCFSLIVKSFHDCPFLSWKCAQSKFQGLLLLCWWYVKYCAFSLYCYYPCTSKKAKKTDNWSHWRNEQLT